MTKLSSREQIRVDNLTIQLLAALSANLGKNKSDLYRIAVYNLAKSTLAKEQFESIIIDATINERGVI